MGEVQAKFREALVGQTVEGLDLTSGVEEDWLTLKLRGPDGKKTQVRISSTSIYNQMYIESVRRKKG
jgi:hypothetical protein